MELYNFTKDFTYGELKETLNSTPYCLKVSEHDDSNVFMVNYKKTDSDLTNDLVKECRGVIMEKETNKLLCYTFDRKETPENIQDFLENNWNDLKFTESIDGTQIKLYYYDDVWNMATTRCINASDAFWYSNKSFETLFRECHDLDYDKLNKNYCYSFVIRHSENRIVADYTDNSLVHVLTRDMSTKTYDIVDHDIGVNKPVELNFNNSNEVLEMVKNSDRTDIEGIFIRYENKHLKLKFDSYMNIKKLRNNTRDLFFEYIENKVADKVDVYKTTFPEFEYDINYYESILGDLIKKLHRLYMEVHVEKTRLIKVVDRSFHRHLYNLHGKHIKEKTKITREVVSDFLYKLDAKQIMHLINLHYRKIDKDGDIVEQKSVPNVEETV